MPAKIGQIMQGDDGQEYMLTAQGWVPNNERLENIASMGTIGALAMGVAEIGTFGLVQAPDEVSQTSPVASMVPTVAETAAAATGIGALATRGVRNSVSGLRMSERVSDQIQASQRSQLIRRPSNIAGDATTAGQVLKRVEGGVEVIPGLNIPLLAQKAINQRTMNAGLARALDLDPAMVNRARQGIDESVMLAARRRYQQDFDAVRDAIGENFDQVRMKSVIEQAADAGLIVDKNALRKLQSTSNLTGKEVMSLRSKMTDILSSNAQWETKEVARVINENIDDIIETALGEEGQALYRAARARYRLWRDARKGAALGNGNQVNPASMYNKLDQDYGDAFAAGDDIPGITPEIKDFMALVREGRDLDVGLPSSGTAERSMIAAGIMTGIGIGAN
jgi:hypothetical protein